MLQKEKILELLSSLNVKLHERNVVGEMGMCGGAVMCVVFDARTATRDVDAIFAPTAEIRDAAKAVALEHDVPPDWLNDAAKGFFGAKPPQALFREWSNLRVWSPSPEYMLAMKCIAARYDTSDADDVKFLINYLKLTEPGQVFALIDKFYPHQQVPAKTRFFIEELMQTQ